MANRDTNTLSYEVTNHILHTKKQQNNSKQINKQKKIQKKQFSESDITKMLELLLDSIFVMFGGRVFQHSRNTYG